jgi:hypothetical protein
MYKILANMTQVSDVAPGPLVFWREPMIEMGFEQDSFLLKHIIEQ